MPTPTYQSAYFDALGCTKVKNTAGTQRVYTQTYREKDFSGYVNLQINSFIAQGESFESFEFDSNHDSNIRDRNMDSNDV